MFSPLPSTHQHASMPPTSEDGQPDTIETRLWIEEHVWLYKLLRGERNISPTFRFPDLIAACIALIFAQGDAPSRIFRFLGTQLVLRSPMTPRRRESMWRQQYELLLEVQRSPANRHPNPKFQLDQLTTACVALCRAQDESGASILQQARHNMVERAQRGKQVRLT